MRTLNRHTKTSVQTGDFLFHDEIVYRVSSTWSTVDRRGITCVSITIEFPDRRKVYGEPSSHLYGLHIVSEGEPEYDDVLQMFVRQGSRRRLTEEEQGELRKESKEIIISLLYDELTKEERDSKEARLHEIDDTLRNWY